MAGVARRTTDVARLDLHCGVGSRQASVCLRTVQQAACAVRRCSAARSGGGGVEPRVEHSASLARSGTRRTRGQDWSLLSC